MINATYRKYVIVMLSSPVFGVTHFCTVTVAKAQGHGIQKIGSASKQRIFTHCSLQASDSTSPWVWERRVGSEVKVQRCTKMHEKVKEKKTCVSVSRRVDEM